MKRLMLVLFLTPVTLAAASGAGWKSVREQTACEAVAPGSCIGEYGFTVDAAGHFIAGPSPAGLRVEGDLRADERRDLQAAIRRVLRSNTAERCAATRNVAGSSERLTLTIDTRERVVYRREGPAQTCVTGNRAAATQLHDVLQRLMAEHYPQRFPQ
jgi:hypothetical protein